MPELADCEQNEAVYLNGDGPTTLGEAVNKLLARLDLLIAGSPAVEEVWVRPLVFRKGKKDPQVLNIDHIRKLAVLWKYGRSGRG